MGHGKGITTMNMRARVRSLCHWLTATATMIVATFARGEVILSDTTIPRYRTVWVDASGTNFFSSEPRYRVIDEWDFGDTTAGARYNVLQGFSSAHFYENPGTYTIHHTQRTLDGRAQSESKTVIVTAPPVSGEVVCTTFSQLVE